MNVLPTVSIYNMYRGIMYWNSYLSLLVNMGGPWYRIFSVLFLEIRYIVL